MAFVESRSSTATEILTASPDPPVVIGASCDASLLSTLVWRIRGPDPGCQPNASYHSSVENRFLVVAGIGARRQTVPPIVDRERELPDREGVLIRERMSALPRLVATSMAQTLIFCLPS